MQEASLATHVKVQYLAVAGPQTTANAQTYVNSLAQSRCDLVFAVGDAQVAATEQGGPRFPAVRFYSVGGTVTQGNLIAVANTTPDQIQTDVSRILRTAVPAPDPED
jgi:basic membrane lipoprotein Med (substrate-binding protein (PBP1-ABC) superfamily)